MKAMTTLTVSRTNCSYKLPFFQPAHPHVNVTHVLIHCDALLTLDACRSVYTGHGRLVAPLTKLTAVSSKVVCFHHNLSADY